MFSSESGSTPWQRVTIVRAQPNAALAPHLPARKKGKIRILLVICRPRGEDDVPFRSVPVS